MLRPRRVWSELPLPCPRYCVIEVRYHRAPVWHRAENCLVADHSTNQVDLVAVMEVKSCLFG